MKITVQLLLAVALVAGGTSISHAQAPWEQPVLPEPSAVAMGGVWGAAYDRGVARIGQDPFTVPYVLADVNFGMKRWFTNYSGDISGRFLELASVTSTRDHPQPEILREVMDKITAYQQPDGHYGARVDWNAPVDFSPQDTEAVMMPTLWGNGRLLLGLVAAYERFGDPRMLASARKLGDFYGNVVASRFCDPQRVDEYRKPSAYAGAYVTCVFQGMEGLVRLYRLTQDARYLQVARRMADFHAAFDTLPVDHSHGSISVHGALLLLFEETRDPRYLQRVTDRWDKAVRGGYINPAGGVLEKYWITGYNRDEGCSEADWLRLNLWLWRDTGNPRYLDMAERLVWSAYLANQWPSGGFGHREIGCDAQGPYAFQKPSQESVWCCSFHGPLGLSDLKSYLATGHPKGGIYYNFPMDFTARIQTGTNAWTLVSKLLPAAGGMPVRSELTLSGAGVDVPLLIRVPGWADTVVVTAAATVVPASREGDYLRTAPVGSGTKLEIAYRGRPYLETRRFERAAWPKELPVTLDQMVVRYGPQVLMNTTSGDIQNLTLFIGPDGALQLPTDNATVKLAPWHQLPNPTEPHAFIFNVRLEKQP